MLHDQGTNTKSLSTLLTTLESNQTLGGARVQRPFATGLDVLDQVLEGGFRPHDLTLIGGQPGIGKTIVTLQWARNMAAAGNTAIYACYEHDHADLMARLMSLELGTISDMEHPADVDKLKTSLTQVANGVAELGALIEMEPLARRVWERMQEYADNLILVRASGRYTTIAALEKLAAEYAGKSTAMFVDYLQKIPVAPEPQNEAEKVTITAEGLKELALDYGTAVIAVVAADNAGLETKRLRLRLHHLRGSSALAYESDVIILINDKKKIVSKGASRIRHGAVRAVPALRDLQRREEPSRLGNDRHGVPQGLRPLPVRSARRLSVRASRRRAFNEE